MIIGDASVRAMKPSFTLRTDLDAAGELVGVAAAPDAFAVVGVTLTGVFAGIFAANFAFAA